MKKDPLITDMIGSWTIAVDQDTGYALITNGRVGEIYDQDYLQTALQGGVISDINDPDVLNKAFEIVSGLEKPIILSMNADRIQNPHTANFLELKAA